MAVRCTILSEVHTLSPEPEDSLSLVKLAPPSDLDEVNGLL